MTRWNLFALVGLATVLLVGSSLALASADLHEPSRAFSSLLELIRNSANQWSSRLQTFAQSLFWLLVAIDVVLIFGPLVVRNADIGEIFSELMRFVLVVGFFASLLIFSVQWSEAIINSFRQAGATAAGVGMQLTPGDMFSLGVELAYTVGDVNTMNPGVAISVALSAIIILLCYIFIAAFMGLTLIQSYVIINAAVLLLGFGGSKFTREYAVAIFRASVAIGAKLFVLTLIVGLVMDSSRQWQMAYQHDNTSMWTMVGLAFVCALLSKTIPEHIETLINGTSSGGGSAIGTMAATGAAFGAGAMAGLHAAAQGNGMLGTAGKSVADLLKSVGGSSGGSSGSSGGSMNSMMGGSGVGGAPGGSAPRPTGSSSPKIGGGGMGSGASPTGSQTTNSSSSGSKGSSSANPASSEGQMPGTAASSGSKTPSVATMAHAAAELGIKTFGTASSIAVPGMEGSESLTVGPPPSPPDLGEMSEATETPENIIRPADANPESAMGPTTYSPQVIDTMSDLQQALDNRGKLS